MPLPGSERLAMLNSTVRNAGSGGVVPFVKSRFFKPLESTFGDLEKPLKNPIYSTTYESRLCARRGLSFMAEIRRPAPPLAPLIRDILEGLT